MKLLLSYLRPYWRLVLLALLLAAINQVFSLLDPLIFRHVIDDYATQVRPVHDRRVLPRRHAPARWRPSASPSSRASPRTSRTTSSTSSPSGSGAQLYSDGIRHSLDAALPGLRGPAQRRDARQAPEGALRHRAVHRGVREHGLHHARRRRLRDDLRLQRPLVDRARVLRSPCPLLGVSELGALRGASRRSRRSSSPRRPRSPARRPSRCATSSS